MDQIVINRISKSVFESPNGAHLVTYSRVTKYIACNCAEFTMFGKCAWADAAQATLEAEGIETHRKRPPKNIFSSSDAIFDEAVKLAEVKVYSGKDFV